MTEKIEQPVTGKTPTVFTASGKPSPSVRREMEAMLGRSDGQLASVWEGMTLGEDIKTMVANQRAASQGAVSNRISVAYALLGERFPTGPASATQYLASINRLVRHEGHMLSEAATAWVDYVRGRLDGVTADPSAVEIEARQISSTRITLEQQVETKGGVYVYSYPHYLDNPTHPSAIQDRPDLDRTHLKVGMTTRDPKKRVREQIRATAAPEDAVICRVYLAGRTKDTPQAMERQFHTLLSAAGHIRDKSGPSREWFVSNPAYLDTIADVLGYVRAGDTNS